MSEAGTKVSYYRARYYDTSAGRFLTEDPIGFASQMDFYAYVRNNPTYFIDPSGLQPMLGPVNPKINTVVCNGSGGLRVQIGSPPPSQAACAEECMRTHEEQHIRDLTAANPRVCTGVVEGITVTFSNAKERAATEVASTLMELQCLRMKKSTAPPNCQLCNRDALDQRIQQMESYLAKNLNRYFF